MTEFEVCVCAAVLQTNGYIVRGHRHDDALVTAGRREEARAECEGRTPLRLNELIAEQGFMTTENRFVGREEGMRLQVAAGAKSACYGELRGGMLFSEDLY